MTQLNFNVQEVPPSAGADVLPAGWYHVMITAEENKQTKNGTGEYCEVEFTVVGGTYANRKVCCRYNLWNTDEQTVLRARSDLAALSLAIGVPITDTAQLLNHQCEVNVKIRKSEQYGDQNDVKGYRPSQSQFAQPVTATAAPVTATAVAPPAAPPAAPATAPVPWNK